MQTNHYPWRRLSPTGKPVESPSALRHVDELMSSRSGPKGLQVERPVAPLSFADSLHERRELVARHPELNIVHKNSGQTPSFRISWNVY